MTALTKRLLEALGADGDALARAYLIIELSGCLRHLRDSDDPWERELAKRTDAAITACIEESK